MQHELIAGFSAEHFQRKLHAGWHSTTDQIEKMKWKQQVCLEVQGPIISEFGFEPSRRGVVASTQAFSPLDHDREIHWHNDIISWLVDPDLQAQFPEGPVPLIPGAAYMSLTRRVLQDAAAKDQAPANGNDLRLVGTWISIDQPAWQRYMIGVTGHGELRIDLHLEGRWECAYGILKRSVEYECEWYEADVKTCRGRAGLTVGMFFDEEHGVLRCYSKPFGSDWGSEHFAYKAGGYKVQVTQLDDDRAITGIARCQGSLAGAHQALYKPQCPKLEQEQWFGILGFRDGILDALESGVLILHAEATNTGEIVGYISCGCNYGDAGTGKHEGGPHAQIHHITVLPEHRGRGVGRMLFKELLSHLQEASPSVTSDLRISVVEMNTEVISWYQRLGFEEVEDWTVYPNNYPVRFINMRLQRDIAAPE